MLDVIVSLEAQSMYWSVSSVAGFKTGIEVGDDEGIVRWPLE
jgi:hypothetical protein